MACAFTPSICHINLGAISRNFKRLGQPSRLMPVIKSDAYGHGLTQVAQTLSDSGATRFAVGGAQEGRALREAGIRQPIVLLMGCASPEEWSLAIRHDLTPLVGSFEDLQAANSNLGERGPLSIAIKCDTGMSRLGFRKKDIAGLLEELARKPSLRPALLLSHLASADAPEDSAYTAMQISTFETVYNALRPAFPEIARSLGNSAATLGVPESHFDLLRPGLAIYGGNPFAGTAQASLGGDLEWAMALEAPILATRELAAGESVSYGRIFTAPRPMRIAVIASGYATGVPRNLSGRFSMLVNGRRARQVGRICMSMLMADITGIPDIQKGDSAWLLGGEPIAGQTAPNAQELADVLGTIPYELLCLLGALNPRRYA